jgi:hypothetical protein
MTVQSEQNNAGVGSATTVTCNYTNANVAGDSSTVCLGPCSFGSITTATITDTELNSYAQLETQKVNDDFIFLCSAQNIKAAAAGANTVQGVINTAAFNNHLPIFIVEGPPASAIRVHASAQGLFGSATATVSLAGTVAGDYVVAFVCACANSGTAVPTAGNAGTNPMTSLQTYNVNDGGLATFMVAAGTSSGGTINVTAHTDNTQAGWVGWMIAAVAYTPGSSTPKVNTLFFSGD